MVKDKDIVERIEQEVKDFSAQYKADIDAMKTVMLRFGLLEVKVQEHDAAIKNLDTLVFRGTNGTPSVVEDIRAIKNFQGSIKFWLTATALGFLGQGVIMFMAIMVWLIQKVFAP